LQKSVVAVGDSSRGAALKRVRRSKAALSTILGDHSVACYRA